ncbi:MAG: cyclopropane fatty acyl phospholipid synthase [Gammaproteobacteria bacterium]|nr:cyclopropane fatty acyl phospholipid synthase [Gammaproteobacteria bacterium]
MQDNPSNQSRSSAQKTIEELLDIAGVKINGNNPWDIQVHNDNFYKRVLSNKELGLGESYMDKWWDCAQLDTLFDKLVSANIESKMRLSLHLKFNLLIARLFNQQTKMLSKKVALQHYDLSNELYSKMLDKRMIYSCAYWKNAETLDEAQEAKLDLICQKLQLEPGMTLLDVGCGWGGLARYAAEQYGVRVTGITLSQQQCDYAKEYCKDFDIQIRLLDYRDINQKYDRIVSVGMFEHVGHKNYHHFMKIIYDALDDHSLFLLHTIGNNETMYATNEWVQKHIFPNSMLPSIAQIGNSSEKLFIMEDWQSFGAYYDRTLLSWHQNFKDHWDELKSEFDERFYRMWEYYLLSSAGCFRCRSIQLWQIVFSRKGIDGVYLSPR